MESLDKKMLIHIGCELLVVGGIAFYLNSKINKYETRILALEQQNNYLRQMCESHDKILRELEEPNQRKPTHKSSHQKPQIKTQSQQKTTPLENHMDNEDALDKELEEEYSELNN